MSEDRAQYLPAKTADAPIAPFGSVAGFEVAQRVAKALQSADIVPQQFRQSMGNTLIAMELAARTGSSILAVMQSLYVVHGKPGWSGSYCIAALNQSGRFAEPLHFEFQGTEGKDDWGCRAVALSKNGKQIVGPLVTVAMAKAEGWYSRNGSKWQTMPELMLRYRAATWFARTEAPELLMGMQTVEELADIGEPAIQAAAAPGVTLEGLIAEAGPGKVSRETETPEPEPPAPAQEWPRKAEDGSWVDSAGEAYASAKHGWNREHGCPSVNQDGTFRARRKNSKSSPPAGDPAAAGPPKSSDTPASGTGQNDRGSGPAPDSPAVDEAPSPPLVSQPESHLGPSLADVLGLIKKAKEGGNEAIYEDAIGMISSLSPGEQRVANDAARAAAEQRPASLGRESHHPGRS